MLSRHLLLRLANDDGSLLCIYGFCDQTITIGAPLDLLGEIHLGNSGYMVSNCHKDGA